MLLFVVVFSVVFVGHHFLVENCFGITNDVGQSAERISGVKKLESVNKACITTTYCPPLHYIQCVIIGLVCVIEWEQAW